jgi:DNA repair exonuclease SbcCD nuclease subunit
MRFSFLHAADLHLNSPLLGLALKDQYIAERFSKCTRDAFSALIDHAIERKAAFVVIAGDIYDGEWRDTSIGLFFNREVARLERENIPLYILKGNHDAESVVTKSIKPTPNTNIFSTSKPQTFSIDALKVALHGRGFPDRAVTENFALTYPPPRAGWFNIGVLHTSCDGRPQHATYAPCTVPELISRGYDYWALGHVHDYEELCHNPWIVFPGNLQGRNARECGPKGAVWVTVGDGHVESVERLILDRARWLTVEVDLTGVSHDSALLERIHTAIRPAAAGSADRLVALRLRVTGATSLDSNLRARLRGYTDDVQAEAHRIHEDIWLEKLVVETSPLTTPALGFQSESLDLAALLSSLCSDPDFSSQAQELIAQVTGKLPGGISLAELRDDLIREASAVVLARTQPSPGSAAECV